MASSSYQCDVLQGFNFQKDGQTLVGHITSLTIGDTPLPADTQVQDPCEIGSETLIKVVGVISSVYWEGGFADPVSFSAKISILNKNTATLLQHKDLSNTNVELGFVVYEYDPIAKAYFKAFHADETKLKGLVLKNGGELEIAVDSEQSMEVPSPKNFNFYLGVMPQEEQQIIDLAVSETDKFSKKWGVTVEA